MAAIATVLVQAWPRCFDEAIRRLLQAVLVATVLVVPWHYGTVTWTDQTVLAYLGSIIGLLTGALVWRQGWPVPPRIAWALSGLLVLGMLQVAPMPRFVWETATVGGAFERQVAEQSEWFIQRMDRTSDGALELDDVGSATWSIHPLQTRATLASMSVAIVFLLASAVSFSSRRSSTILFAAMGIVGFAHAFIGVLQAVAWSQWTLLDMPRPSYFGTFVSRNTAPQFYAIGTGATLSLLGLWASRRRADRIDPRYYVRYPAVNLLARIRRRAEELIRDMDIGSILCILLLVFMLVAVFGAASRGGVLAWFGAAVITLIYAFSRDRTIARYAIFLVALGAISGILVVTLELDDATLERLSTVMEEAESETNPRYRIWLDALSVPNFWWMGSGAGTFHFMIIPWLSMVGSWPYHAESIYVETLASFGLPGIGLLVWGMSTIYREIARDQSRTRRPWRIGIVFALSVICLQSLVDFSLIIPGVYITLVAMVGSWWSVDREDDPGRAADARGRPAHRYWAWGILGILLGSAWMVGIGPLGEFARGERWKQMADRQQSLVEMRLPSSPSPELSIHAGRIVQRNAELLAERLDWPPELEAVKQRLSDAIVLSASFRAPPDAWLAEVGGVIRSDPAIREELERSMTLFPRAVVACPMDWRAALGIARGDCGSLSARSRARNLARLAVLTRFLPSLQTQMGVVALWSGDREIGNRFLSLAVARTPDSMYRLVPLLNGTLTAEEAANILGRAPLRILALAQRVNGNPSVVRQLLEYVDRSEIEELASDVADWRSIAWYARQVQDDQLSIRALRQVARLAPQDHAARFELAKLLDQQGEIDEAMRWIRQAERRSDRNSVYRTYREHLEQRLSEPATGGLPTSPQ